MSETTSVLFEGIGEVPVPSALLQGDPETVERNLLAFRDQLWSQRQTRAQPSRPAPAAPGAPPSSYVDAVAGGLVRSGADVADAVGGVAQRFGASDIGATLEDTARRWRASAERTYQRPIDMPETTFQLIRQGRIGEAVQTLPRDIAESLGSLLVGVAMTGAGPIAATGLGAVTALEQMGSMRQERREAGLDPTTTLTDAGSAIVGAALQRGGGGGGVVRRVNREGLQEVGQEGSAVAGNYVQGVQPGAEEIIDRLGQAYTVGAGTRAGVDATTAAVRLPGQVATGVTRAMADVPRAREVSQYTDEQLVSDLRVIDAYNRRREAERGTERFGTTNSNPDPSVTFKGLSDDYDRALRALIDAEHAAGNITREQRDQLRSEVYSAKRHNRELADNTQGLDYFESQRETIRNMGLNPDVERVLLDGMRDLNTATFNAMMKNKTGPFQRLGSRLAYSGVGAMGIGAMTANPLALLAGAGVSALGGSAGRALDRAAGLSGPEVLARARVVSREAQRRNLQADPIAPEIQDLTNSARTLAQANAATQASQMAQYNAMANQMGLARGGGWAASVAERGNQFSPGSVDIEDPIRAVEDLARAGVLDPQRADTLINDRTARPTEPEMRLITDYVVNAASQLNRESWNARPGTQAQQGAPVAPTVSPDPPVARVGNPAAYDAKMAQVNALNEAIRATATGPQTRAVAENVMGAKDKASKEAAFGQGTGDPAVDALLRAAIAMTSARSRDPGTSVSGSTTGGVSGPPSGTRARAQGFQTVQDPTRRTTQRGGLQVDPFTGNQGRPETGRAAPGARNAVASGSGTAAQSGPALSDASTHPFATKRLQAEQRAREAQQRAQELLDTADVSDAERRGVLLIDPLTVLEKNGGVMPGLKRQDAMAASKNLLEPARKDAGIPVYDDISKPEAQKAVADLLFKESLYHLASSRNALDWYDGKVDTMFNMVERLYPELASDPNAKAMFSAILAITSNGQNVVKNFRDTFKHYGKHRDAVASGDYRIRTDLTGADKADKMNYAFGMWNSLLDRLGPNDLVDFLETKFRTGDLQKLMKDQFGIKWTGGEQAETEVYGASVFGPKIGGGFYVNLRKKFDAVTQDRWFVRTMSRVRGVLYKIPGVSDSQAENLRQALNDADIAEFGLKPRNSWDGADVDSLVEAAMTIYRLDTKQGFPRTKNGKIPGAIDQDTKQFVMVPGADGRSYTGPITPQSDTIRKAAKRIVESFKGKMVDQPENKKQRTHYRAITDDVVKRLNDAGINISVADWQALVWFPEQRYWQRYLGSGSAKTDADYEDAVVMALLDEKREDIPREIYGLMGYSAAEIDKLIADRREKATKIKGKPKDQEDDDADEEDDD